MKRQAVDAPVRSLHQRLRAVAPYLVQEGVADLGVGPLLARLSAAVAADLSNQRAWLLGTAVAGGYPTQSEVDAVRRGLELANAGMESGAVMSGVSGTASNQRDDELEAHVITGAVIVDVDFCASNVHNTGIQRVVRSTMPYWARDHEPVFVSWSLDRTGYRELSNEQRALVLEWTSELPMPAVAAATPLIIPWNCTIVLPEVPDRSLLARQASTARFSGNRNTVIGYDAIPIVSADTVTNEESERFAHYLEVVKYSASIACISESTAGEFAGFSAALPAQGLPAPRVAAVKLPVDVLARSTSQRPTDRDRPLVLMVGSIEPRKNQLRVLSSAESLWKTGMEFELQFIGGGHSWYLEQFDRMIRQLQRKGRSVSVGRNVPDATLADAYEDARIVVFPSLQEGYGLPVAEALATGTPVITTKYGSTAEIAEGGGCLLVDPRDEEEIASALRKLLTDDELHQRLVDEAVARTDESWADYASRLWQEVTSP